jgi:Cys-tRNA(Pro)/Cys-tRNA(Cys) deacylase
VTPAIETARRAGVPHRVLEYRHDPRAAAYGTEAAEKLGLPPQRVFKTLLVSLDGDARRLAVAVVPVAGQLDLKAMAKACQAKKAAMAEPAQAERSTGYLVGGISPLGQKRRLATVIDSSANDFPTIFVSAGRRGLEIELAPADLLQLTGGHSGSIARS